MSKSNDRTKVNESTPAEQLRRKRRLVSIFEKYDGDKSGDIDINELKNIFQELGIKKTDEQIADIIKAGSNSQTGSALNFEQFEKLFSISRLKDVFHKIDSDNSGLISSTELRDAMKILGHKISDAQCDDMLKKVDLDGSGDISFDEFQKFFEIIPMASLESIASHWVNATVVTDCGSDMGATVPTPGLKWWQTVISGGSGGIMSRTITAPLETVKIMAQTGTGTGKGMTGELRSIWSKKGMRGLFAGNLTNCIRVFPTAGLTTTLYIKLLSCTPADEVLDPMEPVYRMSCAGTAALIANALTYPLDLIRARLTVTQSNTNTTISQVFRDIVSTEGGLRGLYKGLRPTLMAVVPFVAIQNASIDILRDQAITSGTGASPLVLMGIGACSGLLAQTVVYPLDVLRRKIQVAAAEPASSTTANVNIVSDRTWLSIRNIVRTNGIRSLFAGIMPTFMKTIPAVAMVATVTQSLNIYFKNSNKASTAVLNQ